MKFIYSEWLIELQGDTESILHLITPPQLRRLVKRDGANEFFHIRIVPIGLPSTQTHFIPLIPEIQLITTKFATLFETPQTLPPSCPTNHHIHLLPNSEPVNIHPYPCPHFLKHKIEAWVDSMLQKWLIRPSTSPFSSSVLLVRKRDGT